MKTCKFPLTGEIIHYNSHEDDDDALVRAILDIHPTIKRCQLKICEINNEKCAFFTSINVRITPDMVLEGTKYLNWKNVVNQSLIEICENVVGPFPELFLNPHPTVFEKLQNLAERGQVTELMIRLACSNTNAEVRTWCREHYKEWIDPLILISYDDVPDVNELLLARDRFSKSDLFQMLFAMSADVVNKAVELGGGLDTVMGWFAFQHSHAPRAMELKRQWIQNNDNSHNMPMLNSVLNGVLKYSTSYELDALVIERMLLERIYPNVSSLLLAHSYIWSRQSPCIVEHILKFINEVNECKESIECPLNTEQRGALSLNQDPQIVAFLLKNEAWIQVPEFLSQPSDEATTWSLAWMEKLVKNQPLSDVELEWLSCNTNVNMVMTIYDKYIQHNRQDREFEWLYAVGKNADIQVELI